MFSASFQKITTCKPALSDNEVPNPVSPFACIRFSCQLRKLKWSLFNLFWWRVGQILRYNHSPLLQAIAAVCILTVSACPGILSDFQSTRTICQYATDINTNGIVYSTKVFSMTNVLSASRDQRARHWVRYITSTRKSLFFVDSTRNSGISEIRNILQYN